MSMTHEDDPYAVFQTEVRGRQVAGLEQKLRCCIFIPRGIERLCHQASNARVLTLVELVVAMHVGSPCLLVAAAL